MIYHDSSEQGAQLCKKLGLEMEKQYEYDDDKYVIFHKNERLATRDYPLLLDMALGNYTLKPVTTMRGKAYDFGEFTKMVDALPSGVFAEMQKEVSSICTEGCLFIPQDRFADYVCDYCGYNNDFLETLDKQLYVVYVREALDSANMDIKSEKDLYFLCVQYVWREIFDQIFANKVYNLLVGKLNAEGKTVLVDDLERIASSITVDKPFSEVYETAICEIEKVATKIA